ncbi:MAG: polyprenyl synthetase family protein [Eubacterium sp.]|nr:polyprenyl synthetase family protein [Eubacterium sp.]
MNDFEQSMAERVQRAEQILDRYLPAEEGYQKTIFEAVNYSVRAGGKRLRPILMREVYEMCGGTDSQVIEPFMAALEMIHTYSLVHDDLPAMDNDDYRRGMLTTHKKFGEDMGILAGDALLNYAYETAFKAFVSGSTDRVAEALRVLGRKAGMYGMVGGQVVDVEENGKFVDEATLLFVYETKTSALLEAAFMIGGILAGASQEQIQSLELSAKKLGIAFQIQDDILDVVGDEEKLGKPVHSDERNEKSTFAAIHGIQKSSEKVKEYTEEALEILASFPGDKAFLEECMGWLTKRDK